MNQFSPLGDSAVNVKLSNTIDEQTLEKVRALTKYLEEHPFSGLVEIVPTFNSICLFYNPLLVGRNKVSPYQQVCNYIKAAFQHLDVTTIPESREIVIPVCYGEAYGPDLEYVARYNGLTPEEVIEIHTKGRYLVYMIGFAPGFPYLGGMSSKIATPRRSSPRLLIPERTVGIAGSQTGIYPINTPGGWQLIGRTPLPLFSPENDPPSFLQVGDIIRFEAISIEKYNQYQMKSNDVRTDGGDSNKY